MPWCCFNGEFFPADTALIPIQNSAFKYGDAFFETIRVSKGNIQLADLHRKRMEVSRKLLHYAAPAFSINTLLEQALLLAEKNGCLNNGRLRIEVYRSEAAVGYAIEALPLSDEVHTLNEKGWKLGLYVHSRKSCDAFANLKSSNFLLYVMAALEAKEKNVDDCLVLNSENGICDSSKANVFIISKGKIITPALHQGCVSGVMRRHVIDRLKGLGHRVYQQQINEADLLSADEVFLTNAIAGMRWVQFYKHRQYGCEKTKELFHQLFH